MQKLLLVLPLLMFVAMLSQTKPAAQAPAQPEPAAQAPAESAPAAQPESTGSAVPAVNPVKATAESQAHARSIYKMDCAMCHAENGNGKGEVVGDMGLKLKDLRDPDTLKDKTDGELYAIIHDGKGQMPAEGDRAKRDEVWNLVILVRSFAKK
jgi:mono/diheme cytochrome c family protein